MRVVYIHFTGIIFSRKCWYIIYLLSGLLLAFSRSLPLEVGFYHIGILHKRSPIIICHCESKNRALPVTSPSCRAWPCVCSVPVADSLAVPPFGLLASGWMGFAFTMKDTPPTPLLSLLLTSCYSRSEIATKKDGLFLFTSLQIQLLED